jgi:hypothetical protein
MEYLTSPNTNMFLSLMFIWVPGFDEPLTAHLQSRLGYVYNPNRGVFRCQRIQRADGRWFICGKARLPAFVSAGKRERLRRAGDCIGCPMLFDVGPQAPVVNVHRSPSIAG